jgi:hypothetical protein
LEELETLKKAITEKEQRKIGQFGHPYAGKLRRNLDETKTRIRSVWILWRLRRLERLTEMDTPMRVAEAAEIT